jgi:hypothetical protein
MLCPLRKRQLPLGQWGKPCQIAHRRAEHVFCKVLNDGNPFRSTNGEISGIGFSLRASNGNQSQSKRTGFFKQLFTRVKTSFSPLLNGVFHFDARSMLE